MTSNILLKLNISNINDQSADCKVKEYCQQFYCLTLFCFVLFFFLGYMQCT